MLEKYHLEIINIIMKKIKQQTREIFIEMPVGTGKSSVIKKIVEQLDSKEYILILTKTKTVESHYYELLKEYQNIQINTYDNQITNDNFSCIIINDAENLSEERYKIISQTFKKTTLIFFCNTPQRVNDNGIWLDQKERNYTLSISQAINEGYLNPKQLNLKFNNFITTLLEKLNFTNIKKNVPLKFKDRSFIIDFTADNNGKTTIIELKEYRSQFIPNIIINQAIEQVEYYKRIWQKTQKQEIDAILLIFCQVPTELKEATYKKKNIIIIDILNLLYLLQNDENLMKQLIENVQYNIQQLQPQPPLVPTLLKIKESTEENTPLNEIKAATNFIEKLQLIGYGKNDFQEKEYEKICVEIIKYLFKIEFTKMSEQNNTEDKMFRMDLVCGLKGTSEFWKILIQHYNTRFVVFEFKNYESKIDQNLIYITEKYLYNAVLRNVAIIVSRNGFSDNARKAATGILAEDGKLIIELKDIDIINMLRMKADGEDPSDYMLEILENYLMSISK